MIYKNDCTLPNEYLEQLTEQGFEELLDLVWVLVSIGLRILFTHLAA